MSYPRLRRTVAGVAGLAVLLLLPRWASAGGETNILGKAGGVLEEMVRRDDIPPALLAKARCIVVLPDVMKFTFGIGGTGGRGAVSCRTGKSFNGPWSAPSIYSLSKVNVGLLGGSSTDYVLLVMTDRGVISLVKGKTKLGASVTIAAGPTRATTTSSPAADDILSYARSTKMFVSVSLGGATLDPDDSANRDLYAKAITAREILVANAVPPPPAAKPLMALLNSKVKAH